jgi:integrase
LTPYIDYYLDEVRPALLGDNDSKSFWINKDGGALAQHSVYSAFVNTTEALLGVRISPHAFRYCAATTVAIHDPEHIGIASQILGHTDPGTTEQHYIQANSLIAGRRLRHSIDSLRKELHPRAKGRPVRTGEDP